MFEEPIFMQQMMVQLINKKIKAGFKIKSK
jgi:hypothetical protein